MTMFNAKGNRLMRMNLRSLPQRQNFMEEKLWWDHHGIIHFEFLNHNQTLNKDLYQQHMHENHLRKHLALVN